MTKIIIDALGADEGPDMVAEALLLARKERDFDAVLVGPKKKLAGALSGLNRLEFMDTDEYIRNDESPVLAIRKKKNSSHVVGMTRLNEEGDVFLSAGSTGALLAGGYFIVKRIKGIDRACLAVSIPSPKGNTLLLDSGANMDTDPHTLYQFALLGQAYLEASGLKDRPRVGLLNVGSEEGKGDKRSLETYRLLKESTLNFVGNIEAREILDGACDILVTDGFAGNVALKTLEGAVMTMLSGLKGALGSSLKTKLGGLLIKSALKDFLKDYNYKDRGGAPLLGISKPVYKAHGNSTAHSFKSAILEALDYAESGVEAKIIQMMNDMEEGNE